MGIEVSLDEEKRNKVIQDFKNVSFLSFILSI